MTSVGPGGAGATRDALLAELRALLEEPMDAARGRERALRAELAAQPEMPIVLFGAGNLGRCTLSLLRAAGDPPTPSLTSPAASGAL